jgi:predicted helicase
MRCRVEDVEHLEKLLKLFFAYERPEIEAFRKAVEQFKTDLPKVLDALRDMIETAHGAEAGFRKAAATFLKHAQEAINPSLTEADVREMLIQHVLTGEIFQAVFPGTTYHEDNNVAVELHKLEATFFTGNTKHQTLKALAPYYTAIRKAAAEISTHHEKQAFLKAIYEDFYKVYNPKAADRLGVVYTPNEIVRFMIESADWLCQHHFKRNLIDRNVDILDPATGTGTFVCELIAHFAGQKEKLAQKYRHELHANEVAILPYYVANLNIEATYAAASGVYEEFPGLCFVDTLDNTQALRKHKGHMEDLFGGVSDENIGRIRQQNSKTISVIIGNPPYNANQLNENENNKNREYPEIDKRIKETYIEQSTAQKTKLYDMYARFFRWATDRLDENGILALVTNRSFIDSRTFDGFRAMATKEFDEIRVVDLGGDVRANPKLSGTTHNVFGIQTGVAISFLIRKKSRPRQKPTSGRTSCRILYARRPEMETAQDKLSFLGSTKLHDIAFEELRPDEKNNWINQGEVDYNSLLPLAEKGAGQTSKYAIFSVSSLGVSTNRDEWVTDFSKKAVAKRMEFFVHEYSSAIGTKELPASIKHSRNLKRKFAAGLTERFSEENIVMCQRRPFVQEWLYLSRVFVDEHGQLAKSLSPRTPTQDRYIAFHCISSANELCCFAGRFVPDLNMLKRGNGGTFYVPEQQYGEDGTRADNVTDWALSKFRKHYAAALAGQERAITKEAIFCYVYGVLHNPAYRAKYALNLKREFPRIPFYNDFWQWAGWGKALLDLHLGYESAKPFTLKRFDAETRENPKAKLRAEVEAGEIILDEATTLGGVPPEAWDYKLGNRSALEWVLDQYKEKTPKDRTIRDKFNTYRFADHKDKVIDLLMRVCTVSVETQKIVRDMRLAS